MFSHIEPKTFGERVEKFLRTRHPVKTADHVASLAGCSRAQVSKWLEGTSAPGGLALVRLIAAYGPQFILAVMGEHAPRWLDDAHRAQKIQELEAGQARIEEELRALAR